MDNVSICSGVLRNKVPLTPNPWEGVEIGLAILFKPIVTPEGYWHAWERGCDDEFAFLPRVFNIGPSVVPDLQFDPKACSGELVAINGYQGVSTNNCT